LEDEKRMALKNHSSTIR